MPLLPEDFDDRFFIAAPPGLFFERYLEGGEPVNLINVSPDGPLEFYLPRCTLKSEVQIKEETLNLPLFCHTILFEPDDKVMSMTWHTSTLTGNNPHNVEEITLSVESLEGVHE